MSTRRHAIVFYGYSMKQCEFALEEQLTKLGLDVLTDGMSGDYMLVGKQILDYNIDSYDAEDEPEGVVELGLTVKEQNDTNIKLYSATSILSKRVEGNPKLLFVVHYT